MTAKACNPSRVPLLLLPLLPLIKCNRFEHAYRMSPVCWRLATYLWPTDPFKFFLFICLPFCHGPPSMILATQKNHCQKDYNPRNRRTHCYNHSIPLISPLSLHDNNRNIFPILFRAFLFTFEIRLA